MNPRGRVKEIRVQPYTRNGIGFFILGKSVMQRLILIEKEVKDKNSNFLGK